VPLVGRIFASEPVLLPGTDSPVFGADEAIEITRGLLPADNGLFALQVKGDSMIDAMVSDGDIVVMTKADEWRNGDMVAVWLRDRERPPSSTSIVRGAGSAYSRPTPPCSRSTSTIPRASKVQGKVMLVVVS
jgi:repressor LexA